MGNIKISYDNSQRGVVMKYTVSRHAQGTPEWFKERAGCVTGSMASVIYAQGKSGSESIQRINYKYQLAEERVTGIVAAQDFQTPAMRRGTELEPMARLAYEGEMLAPVSALGFIRVDGMFAGCSVDSATMRGENIIGVQEFKCPMLKTHIEYLKNKALPETYRPQVIHNLWCTGAEWMDFMSYYPAFKKFLVRVYAKDLPLEEHGKKLQKFLEEVAETENEVRGFIQ